MRPATRSPIDPSRGRRPMNPSHSSPAAAWCLDSFRERPPSPRPPRASVALHELPFDRRVVNAFTLALALALALCLTGTPASAQSLLPKRTLTTAVAPGCDVLAASPAARVQRNNAEARRLA